MKEYFHRLDDVVIPSSEFVDEHKRLLGTLRSGDPKKLKAEYDEQSAELKKHLSGGKFPHSLLPQLEAIDAELDNANRTDDWKYSALEDAFSTMMNHLSDNEAVAYELQIAYNAVVRGDPLPGLIELYRDHLPDMRREPNTEAAVGGGIAEDKRMINAKSPWTLAHLEQKVLLAFYNNPAVPQSMRTKLKEAMMIKPTLKKKKLKGGLSGVSKASGFIRRLMWENSHKHEGEYGNPTWELAKDSTMKKPEKFDYKKLASSDQGGLNKEGNPYGASPFIAHHFSKKEKQPKTKSKPETSAQKKARMKFMGKEVKEPRPSLDSPAPSLVQHFANQPLMGEPPVGLEIRPKTPEPEVETKAEQPKVEKDKGYYTLPKSPFKLEENILIADTVIDKLEELRKNSETSGEIADFPFWTESVGYEKDMRPAAPAVKELMALDSEIQKLRHPPEAKNGTAFGQSEFIKRKSTKGKESREATYKFDEALEYLKKYKKLAEEELAKESEADLKKRYEERYKSLAEEFAKRAALFETKLEQEERILASPKGRTKEALDKAKKSVAKYKEDIPMLKRVSKENAAKKFSKDGVKEDILARVKIVSNKLFAQLIGGSHNSIVSMCGV